MSAPPDEARRWLRFAKEDLLSARTDSSKSTSISQPSAVSATLGSA